MNVISKYLKNVILLAFLVSCDEESSKISEDQILKAKYEDLLSGGTGQLIQWKLIGYSYHKYNGGLGILEESGPSDCNMDNYYVFTKTGSTENKYEATEGVEKCAGVANEEIEHGTWEIYVNKSNRGEGYNFTLKTNIIRLSPTATFAMFSEFGMQDIDIMLLDENHLMLEVNYKFSAGREEVEYSNYYVFEQVAQ
jgi:hypothetical protein